MRVSQLVLTMALAFGYLSAQDIDLLLKGGHVIDAKNGIDGLRDVAISDGKIARVANNITDNAEIVVDDKGYVCNTRYY